MANDFNAELNIEIKGGQSIAQATREVEDLDKALLQAAESAEKLEKAASSSAVPETQQETQRETQKTSEQYRETGNSADKAAKQAEKAWQKNYDSLSNTRYALYDVAAMYGSVGIAAGGVTAALSGVAMEYEKSFANVARTTMETGEALGNLRKDLIGLSQDMPVAFSDLADIATLGAQLGIANDDIAGFTETVAQFAATTDVTVERTATAIGRLTQLTKTPGAEISNLASAIYQTGVTAVATEGEILSVAEQIATAGDLAGLANHEIVALASTLASLGVAPESARGSMMRIFDTIERGATNGGETLQQLAAVSGMSAAEIQEQWGKNSQVVFTQFVEGLGKMQDAGENTNAVLKDLGIGSVRDIRAMQLLANNTEVYAQALGETSTAYRNNTALAEGYAIGTDTLVDRLERLKNNLKALVGQGSELNDMLKSGIDILNAFLEPLSEISSSPVGRVFLGFATGAAMAVAAWAAYNVTLNLARGSLAAFITAQAGLTKAGVPLQLGLAGIAKTFYQVAKGGKVATDQLLQTGTIAEATGTRLQRAGTFAKSAGVAIGGLAKSILPLAASAAVVWGVTKAFEALGEARKSASQKANERFDGFAGLSDAIIADTKAGDDSIRSLTVTVTDQTDKLAGWATKLQEATGTQIGLSDATKETTRTTREATMAIGENTAAVMAQMAIDATIHLWKEYGEQLEAVGVTAQEFAAGVQAGTAADMLSGKIEDQRMLIGELSLALGTTTDKFGTAAEAATAYGNAINLHDALKEMRTAAGDLAIGLEEQTREAAISTEIMEAFGVTVTNSTEDLDEGAGKVDTLTDSIRDLISSAQNVTDLNDVFYDMGSALATNGLEFDNFSANGRANMEELYSAVNFFANAAGDDSGVFVANVFAMMDGLQQQGVVVGEELDWVYQLLNQVVGNQYGIDFTTQAARENIHKFVADLIVAQKQALLTMERTMSLQSPLMTDEGRSAMQAQYDAAARKLQGLEKLQGSLLTATERTVEPVRQISRGYADTTRGANDTASGSEKAAKNAKELKKEIRTSADYAKDLSGVFDQINDIVFGLRNAKKDVKDTFNEILESFISDSSQVSLDLFTFDRKEARDGIAQQFIDLKQAAADARKEVRDATLAVQDAYAKMQGLRADGATLDYQLRVAKALGSAERVAEIEAKIAQNKADQASQAAEIADAEERRRKAVANTSTSTTGNSEVAIGNRAALRDLSRSYMEYIDMLREAGVSEKKIQEVINSSVDDFEAQGTALGFSETQMAPYTAGIAGMTGTIEKNSTALKGNEDALDDLYQAHVDAVTAYAATGASQKAVEKFARKSREEFFKQATQLGYNRKALGDYNTAWAGVIKTIKTLPSNVTIRTNVNKPSDAPIREFITRWNNSKVNLQANTSTPSSKAVDEWRAKNTGGRGASKPITIPIETKVSGDGKKQGAAQGAAYGAAWARSIKRETRKIKDPGIPGGEAYQLYENGRPVGRKFFRKGGWTGDAPVDEATGVVHGQEYVFPAEATDPRTRLPRPEALIAMLGQTVGSLPFMAGGQQVSAVTSVPSVTVAPATSQLTLVELIPSQMQMLAGMIAQAIPDNPMLSQIVEAVNQVNSVRTGKGQG